MKTEIIKVHPEFPDMEDISRCARIIRQGGLIIFPTETVYGIAANFSSPEGMTRLREVKKRSGEKPFSVLISQTGLISNYTSIDKTDLYKLIYSYWPGPLTVVVPDKNVKGKTIGIRMPDNTIALKLVQESRCAIAAPSANFEGNSPPTTCEEALRDLDGLVDIAIDGGSAIIGKGSTVVDITGDDPVILREGVITQEEIQKTVNKKVILFICTGNSCRSVMAEYLLRSKVRGRDDVDIYSAGTGVFIHSTASNETISVLRERGIDATNHVSRPVNSLVLHQADLIFVMTKSHRSQILDRVPEVEKRVYLMREFIDSPSAKSEMDIADPMGGSHAAYKDCLIDISKAVDKIATLI